MNASGAVNRVPTAAHETPRRGGQANGNGVVDRILADIEALAPKIAARASEAEAARRIPGDIVEALTAIGIFRLAAPEAKGGLELDYPDTVRILQRLARIDGSLGWFCTLRSGGGMFLPLLPNETYEELYRQGPDVAFSGASQPAGTAEAVEGGWRINGRWPFVSGCEDADWLCVHCVLTRDGQPIPGKVAGSPATSFVLLPAREARIEDTWYSSGLKATGSHHIAFDNVMAAESNLIDLAAAQPCVPGALYNAPMQLLTLLHGSLALGMAEGAMDDIVFMARSGRRQLRSAAAMQDSEIFQYELGRAQAKLRAAQMALDAQAASNWQHASAGTLKTDAMFAETTQTAIWLTETSLDIIQTCFRLGGGAAVYESFPLQRRLRDIEAAAQHAGIQQSQYAQAGKLFLNKAS